MLSFQVCVSVCTINIKRTVRNMKLDNANEQIQLEYKHTHTYSRAHWTVTSMKTVNCHPSRHRCCRTLDSCHSLDTYIVFILQLSVCLFICLCFFFQFSRYCALSLSRWRGVWRFSAILARSLSSFVHCLSISSTRLGSLPKQSLFSAFEREKNWHFSGYPVEFDWKLCNKNHFTLIWPLEQLH